MFVYLQTDSCGLLHDIHDTYFLEATVDQMFNICEEVQLQADSL